MLKVLSNILCDLDPKVNDIGQKVGICDGVPSTSALVMNKTVLHYHKFVFIYIFRSANLILNLFSLMVDANIPDIALEPDKTVKKVMFIRCTSNS